MTCSITKLKNRKKLGMGIASHACGDIPQNPVFCINDKTAKKQIIRPHNTTPSW